MGKVIFKFVPVVILFFFAENLSANLLKHPTYFKLDTIFQNNYPEDYDTLSVEEEIFPDESQIDIFSEKLNSLSSTWFIKNAFNSDSTDVYSGSFFPMNLPDSLYIQRLGNAQQVIGLSFNEEVKNFIKMYTERKRNQVEIMLGLSAYYFPIFEETLDRYDLPLELKYLPIIESALNPQALSRVGANGLWQFMYGTGKNMNLEINSFVDERRDPLKSTDAAARYLKQLHDIYGDWHLAIAAYNCGPGNVNRAIKRSGDKTNYWEIYYRLPRETRGYIPAFIAATYVMNYYKEHNLMPRMPEIPLFADTIMVHDYLHFDQISANLEIDKEQLRSLNPMYRRDIIPAKKGNPYPLTLPRGKIMEFMAKDTLVFAFDRDKYFPKNTLVKPTENSGSFIPGDVKGKAKIVYTVKSGDNIGFISSWYKVRSSDLAYWNNIHRNLIKVGQKLAIYVPENQKEKFDNINKMSFAEKQAMIGKTVKTASVPETILPNSDFEYYTVKSGDNLWVIAQKYSGVTTTQLMQLNNIIDDRGLYVGQKLKIKKKI